ncbi:MAG TPA: LacI family DNA-binding transcriptional regulator [Ktedonobacteraceae bacterium]|nr:LacI family DNA-binding transcriptional regulator [Ktedonobacteraceae bacterium]
MTLKKKKITIHDIAQMAEVSHQTVSRVLNDSQSVSEATRKRVLQTMRQLEYVPNKVAQMLITNKSLTLQLLYVDVKQGGRLAESMQRMVRIARESGYDLLVTSTTERELGKTLENAASRLVDGIIMHAPRLRIADEELLALCNGLPLVRRDYVPDSRLAWVGFDQEYATRQATEHLIMLGHRQIAAIPQSLDLMNGYWRFVSWQKTLHNHGLEPGPMCASADSIRNAYETMQTILATSPSFTALVVGTDTIAVGAMEALRERGLRIPEDVSVVSFNNTELSAFTHPPLTTIDFKFDQQDSTAVKYLIDILHDPEMNLHRRVLLSDLIIRKSTQSLLL